MKKTNNLFMAFSKGNASSEEVSGFKKYFGGAPIQILAVNPSKDELSKLYNTEIENEPQYTGKMDVDGKEIDYAKIDFIVKYAGKNTDINLLTKLTFFVRKEPRYNKDRDKIQVIDKYSRTCWVTLNQAKNHEIPVYKNGPANIDKDYRPCFVGEEDLTLFIRKFLGIKDCMEYVNQKWVMKENPQDYEGRLEQINNYFKGDFSEITDAINILPNNKVIAVFGIKTSPEGKQYQAVYTKKFMFYKPDATDFSSITKEIQNSQNAGAYSNVEFYFGPIKEYEVTPTKLDEHDDDDLPSSDDLMPWD